MSVETTLESAVYELALRREWLRDAKDELAKRKAEFEAENAELIRRCEALSKQLAESEATVRDVAVAQYDGTNKHPVPGVTIRTVKQLDYDKREALDWAIRKGLRQLIRLDARAFEKAAAGLQPECVKVREVPKVSIARDLSRAMTEIDQALAEIDQSWACDAEEVV